MLNHILLQYRCLNYCYFGIRHVYLIHMEVWGRCCIPPYELFHGGVRARAGLPEGLGTWRHFVALQLF